MLMPWSVYPIQILIVSRPSNTSSFVSTMPLTPFSSTDWRTRTASNQPHLRLRPVLVPNSGKRLLEAAYHIGGFCEILGVPEVLGLMSTSASGHYSSPQAGSLSVECS